MHPTAEPLTSHARDLLGTGAQRAGPHRVADPASDGVLAELSWPGAEDVGVVVRNARRAHERIWSRLPGAERGRHLLNLARAVRDHRAALAELESRDTGTPLPQILEHDLPSALAHLLHHAGWADKLAYAGRGAGPDGTGPRSLGVTAHLLPGSASIALALRTVAPALAAGNTVVLVAPEHSPLASVALAGLTSEWPEGVFSVLVGPASPGATLADTPGLDGVVVTGSTQEVAAVQRQLVGSSTHLVSQVTGTAITVLLDDAPPHAVEDVVTRAVIRHGRTGGVGSRLLIQRGGHEDVIDRLRRRMATLVVGDPSDLGTDVGPLASVALRDRATRLIDAGVRGGARRWTAPRTPPTAGAYLAPTVLEDLPVPVRGQEPLPGPVVPAHLFDDLGEAVALTDDQGSPAVVWTSDRPRARILVRALGPDTVWADNATCAKRPGPAAVADYLRDD